MSTNSTIIQFGRQKIDEEGDHDPAAPATEPDGAHPCTDHPVPSAVRECNQCGATIFPRRYAQCSEGHFLALTSDVDPDSLNTMWCWECDNFQWVTAW